MNELNERQEVVIYICDQKADCCTSDRCGKECHMTFDPHHARNFDLELVNGKEVFTEKELRS